MKKRFDHKYFSVFCFASILLVLSSAFLFYKNISLLVGYTNAVKTIYENYSFKNLKHIEDIIITDQGCIIVYKSNQFAEFDNKKGYIGGGHYVPVIEKDLKELGFEWLLNP